MKKFILILSVSLILFACSDNSTNSDTLSPTIEIINPNDNSEFVIGALINIIAEANDDDGISEVQFFIDGNHKFSDENEPYKYSWDTGQNRDTQHTLYAKVFNINEISSISNIVNVTLTDSIGNPPNPPTDPSPANFDTSIFTYTILSWICTDPDGDSLTYDVYFGTNPNQGIGQLIFEDLNTTYLQLEELSFETTYYWRIVASDGHQEIVGDIWQFTTQDENSSDPLWAFIPAGDYTWGRYDEILSIDYHFEIMKYPVTNIEYITFLEEAYDLGDVWIEENDVYGYYEGDENYPAGNYKFYDLGSQLFNNYAQISWEDNSFIINVPGGYSLDDFDSHPVVKVTWFGAWAYANYYGLRLPSDHEWEKVARGLTSFDFLWGDNLLENGANFLNSEDPWDNGTTPIGYYNGQNGTIESPSQYGCYDMCGNVAEWTDEWFDASDPEHHTLRGGYWESTLHSEYLCVWGRQNYNPLFSTTFTGFRCARTP